MKISPVSNYAFKSANPVHFKSLKENEEKETREITREENKALCTLGMSNINFKGDDYNKKLKELEEILQDDRDKNSIIGRINEDNIDAAELMIKDKEFPRLEIGHVLYWTNKENSDLAEYMISSEYFPNDEVASVLSCIDEDNIDFARKIIPDVTFPQDNLIAALTYSREHYKQWE